MKGLTTGSRGAMSVELDIPPRPAPPAQRPLLVAKLTVPDVAPGAVARSRLEAVLDGATSRALTVVAAPPGFGKTVLVAAWARRRTDAAWLTVDESDSDPARFLGYALAAVRPVARGAGADELARIEPLPPFTEVDEHYLAAGANALAALEGDVVLVLDDFHRIAGSPTERLIEQLLRFPAPRLHLVIVTRVDPALSLQRLRLEGQLAEVRADGLAFDPDEARELFSASHVDLDDNEIHRLLVRTEGWAAALRLAAVTLADADDSTGFVDDFTGDDRVVGDYLLTEVLHRQPAHVRDFLLRTSVVTQLCGELADALTGSDDGDRMLEQAHAANLFLVALDRRRRWYRWHQMFAELLRSRLRIEAPGLETQLHTVAASWFEARGMSVDAAQHAAAADDWDTVARAVGECFLDLVFDSGSATLRSLLALVPEGIANDSAELTVARGVLAIEDEDMAAVQRLSQRAAALADALPPHRRLLVEAIAAVEGLYVATMTGRDADGVRKRGLALLAELDETPFAGRALQRTQVLLLYRLGAFETGDLRWEAAADHLRRALHRAREMGVAYLELSCLAQFISHDFRTGRLDRAQQRAGEILATAEERGWGGYRNLATTHDNVAGLAILRGDLDVALEHLAMADDLVHPSDFVNRLHILFLLGVAQRATGRVADARATLDRVCALGAQWDHPDWLTPSLVTAQADQLAAEGRPEEALAAMGVLDHTQPGASVTRPHGVVYAALLVRVGRAAEARALLAPWTDPALGRPVLTAALVTDAIAAEALGQHDVGLDRLERALEAAHADRLVWPFVSAGPALPPLLKERVDVGTAYHDFAVDVLTRTDRGAPSATPSSYVEPLSERELVVLRLLQGTLRNDEIAARLFVSVNTVKTHIKSINRKLGTSGRREAVQRARELAIL